MSVALGDAEARAYPRPRPRTPQRSVRVREELWHRAQERAFANGETVTDVLVRALEDYCRGTAPTATGRGTT